MAALAPAATPGRAGYWPRGAADLLWDVTAPEVLIEGPAGTGKSYACLWRLHTQAIKYPGMRALMLRKELTALTGSALVTYQDRVLGSGNYGVDPFGGSKFSPAEYRYPNSSKIVVGGMDKASKIMSAEYDLIYVNEATDLSESDWEALSSRLRYGRMPYQQLLGDCNPAGASHWLNQRCDRGQTVRLRSRHRDNPLLWCDGDWTLAGREYMARLESLTGAQRERLLEGRWSSVEGAVYAAFDRGRYVRRMDTEGWRVLLPCDIGSRNPTAILTMHVAGDVRVHISHEVYRRNMTATGIVDEISERADAVDPESIPVDPSAKGTIDDLAARGYPVMAADNAVEHGIRQVQAAIAENRFSVDPSCVNLIDEFESYRYPDGARATTDKPVKEHDHALDALRYGVMAALLEPMTVEIW